MSQDLMNISAFKGIKPAQAFSGLDPAKETLADGIGSSYGIVGYKGKNWSLRLRGETHNFLRPDDGTPAPFLDVIILRQLPMKSKSFYPPGSYVDGQMGTRPICAALDGVMPDADIATPQSTACAICPRNVFKVSPDGRKTRDCSDYKRLAVLVLPKLTKDLLGAPLMEPVFLRVPAASLNDLALLGEGMASQGFHFSSFITRIGFNPEKPHPQMTFRALQPLADREAAVVLPMREDPAAFRITGEHEVVTHALARNAGVSPSDVAEMAKQAREQKAAPHDAGVDFVALVAKKKAAEAAQVEAAKLAERAADIAKLDAVAAKAAQLEADRVAAHKEAEEAAKAKAKAAEATTVDTGFGDDPGVAPPVTAAVNPQQSGVPGSMDTGFDVSASEPSPIKTDAAQNTVEDTGAPEESDDDLDARIASILPK